MTETEKTIIKKFIADKILWVLCRRHISCNKRKHLKLPQDALNKFVKNLNFTMDTFDNFVPHFLDIKIHSDGLSIYCKNTNLEQYTHYNSYLLNPKHLGFLPLYIDLSLFVIKISYKQNSLKF